MIEGAVDLEGLRAENLRFTADPVLKHAHAISLERVLRRSPRDTGSCSEDQGLAWTRRFCV